MKYQRIILAIACILTSLTSIAQSIKAYPSSWWVGMKHPDLQLMIHDPAGLTKEVSLKYPGVSIVKVHQPENHNYIFVDIRIFPTAKPGKLKVNLAKGKSFDFTLDSRNKNNGTSRVKGVHANDFLYLIMPDRFVNGDTVNDHNSDLLDKSTDRSNPFARHGGDIKGVEKSLDYLSDLGVTTVWMTPVLENNMPQTLEAGKYVMSGYHGYWITDHYQVDKRLGGNDAYKSMVNAAHAKGMKVIQDAVYNHVGDYHHTVLDLPMKEWLNQWPSYQGANHRDEVFFDPYTSASDKKIMLGGWFVPHLPDLNLANPFVANFIIQSTVWSTEMFGIDGWRVDTYKYCDEKFLNRINDILEKEFPALTVFGEAWSQTVTGTAYFSRSNIESPFRHNAQGVTDFPLASAMLDAVNQPFGWTEGVNRLYMTLAQDVLYKDPMRNCIFLDNHDMNRVFSMVGTNDNRYRMVMGLLLTMRGIPQMYYGTEILMKNFKDPTDAEVRKDFPGGWNSDPINKFSAAGRTAEENAAFDFIRKLAQFRKKSSALGSGKFMHYIPVDGLYVYFRYDKGQTIMCVLNSNNEKASVNTDRFSQNIMGFTSGKDVITGNLSSLARPIDIAPKTLLIMELN